MTQNELLEIILRNIEFIQLKKCDLIANEATMKYLVDFKNGKV